MRNSYECYVTFLFYPNHIHPAEITKMLGIEPTYTAFVGELKTNSEGRTRTSKMANWHLSSEGKLKSVLLEEHLDWLLDRLMNSKQAILHLQTIEGIKMHITCVCNTKSCHNIHKLTKRHAQMLAELDLTFDFDAYFDYFWDILG
jgi:hypothetical protein